MRSIVSRFGVDFFFIALMSFMVVIAMNSTAISHVPLPDIAYVQSFKMMFISIILEAVPFILLGVLVSSFMQIFISEKWIRRIIPQNPLIGILIACLLGILFPVCECGLIPIVRRLIAKGMPLYVGVVFILVGPIVNPVVYAATYSAFRSQPEMLYARMGLALAAGVFIGLFLYAFVRKNQLKNSKDTLYAGLDEPAGAENVSGHNGRGRFFSMLEHAGSEFFEMGKYLMLGSVIAAAIQAFVPRSDLAGIGQGQLSSNVFMMGFAYILSLCSTSDAFVASSFIHTFSSRSLLVFMVFGPMLDFKSTLMLLSIFKTRFVFLLALLIMFSVLTGAALIDYFYLAH